MQVIKHHTNVKIAVGVADIPYMSMQHIFDLYALATDLEKQTDWYSDAYEFANELALKHNLSIVQVANVIAALSPQMKWEKNKLNAKEAIEAYVAYRDGWLTRDQLPKVHTFTAMSNNAYAILFGEHFTLGQKTASFAANILGNYNVVTVDSLAMSILLGFYRKAGSYKIYKVAYKYAQSLYIEASKQLGISPAHLQAVVWVVCRRLKMQDRKQKGIGILEASQIVGNNPLDILEYINR